MLCSKPDKSNRAIASGSSSISADSYDRQRSSVCNRGLLFAHHQSCLRCLPTRTSDTRNSRHKISLDNNPNPPSQSKTLRFLRMQSHQTRILSWSMMPCHSRRRLPFCWKILTSIRILSLWTTDTLSTWRPHPELLHFSARGLESYSHENAEFCPEDE